MSTRVMGAMFLSLTAGVFLCSWVACSPENEQPSSVNVPPPLDAPKSDIQKTPPTIEKAKAETEGKQASPKVDEPPAEQNDSIDAGEKPGDASVDKDLPAEIFLLSKLWETPTKGGVKFTHEIHATSYEIRCDECHHVFENGKNVWNKTMPAAKCETCHDEPTVKGETKLTPEEKIRNLKLAFHNNCRKCHKEIKKEDPETKAPLKCSQCHEKKT